MKKVICSFANKQFSPALKRLEGQINKISFFDEYFLFNEHDLDNEFKNEYKDILIDGSRGYGYWVWKPYIILKTLEQLDEGDTLLYIDAGCHINYRGKKRFAKYYKLLNESRIGIIAFQLTLDQLAYSSIKKFITIKDYFLERNWTKGDLLDYFNVRENSDITDSPQILSGIILLRKSEETVSFISKWMKVYVDNFQLINDSLSNSNNLNGFLQNRHDQSVFSILCKLHHVDLLSTTEVEAEPAIINNHPILAIRDIGGRLPYKSFQFYRLTRIIKSPFLLIQWLLNPQPKIKNR